MKALSQLQNQFQNYLLDSNLQFQNCIINTDKVPAEIRLGIYGNAYRIRLIEALAANYPILHMYVGDDQFEELGEAYLKTCPSTFRSIRWFGDCLANFLSNHSSYKEYPYLAELAQFEWTLTLAFDAIDDNILQIEEMASIPPDAWINMQLQMHPAVHRLSFSWNIIQIWQALSDENTPPEPVHNLHPVEWVLWRREFASQFCSLSNDEAWAIDAMRNGGTFSEICEGLCQWIDEDEAALRAASLLKSWISQGLITKVKLKGE